MLFNRTSEEEKLLKKYYNFLNKFRKKYVPKQYNQIKLAYDLPKKDVTHLFSLSNRSDGKTTNYLHFFINLAIEFDWLKFAIMVRHWDLKIAMETQVVDIFNTFDDLDVDELLYKRTPQFTTIWYKGKNIGILYDLNKASDLKNTSGAMKHYPIILYDEFLALKDDYVPYEWEKLQRIYQTTDKKGILPLITHPKIFYLGNAENFYSPVLSGLKMYNILETHPINEKKLYYTEEFGTIALENHFNKETNKNINTNAFGTKDSSMYTGQFKVNRYNILTKEEKQAIDSNKQFFFINFGGTFIKVVYNQKTYKSYLSVESFLPSEYDYQFNSEISDNTENSVFLKESFYDEEHIKKYEKGMYLFDNVYTKEFITDNSYLASLKINKLISYYKTFMLKDVITESEKVIKDNYMEKSLESLVEKFGNGVF